MLLLVCKFSGYFRKRKLVTELLVKMLPMSWCAEGKRYQGPEGFFLGELSVLLCVLCNCIWVWM